MQTRGKCLQKRVEKIMDVEKTSWLVLLLNTCSVQKHWWWEEKLCHSKRIRALRCYAKMLLHLLMKTSQKCQLVVVWSYHRYHWMDSSVCLETSWPASPSAAKHINAIRSPRTSRRQRMTSPPHLVFEGIPLRLQLNPQYIRALQSKHDWWLEEDAIFSPICVPWLHREVRRPVLKSKSWGFGSLCLGQTSPRKQEAESWSPDACLGVKQNVLRIGSPVSVEWHDKKGSWMKPRNWKRPLRLDRWNYKKFKDIVENTYWKLSLQSTVSSYWLWKLWKWYSPPLHTSKSMQDDHSLHGVFIWA